MLQKLLLFIQYIIFLNLLNTIICSKRFNYNRCSKYLNDLCQYCSKYAIDENGFNNCIKLDNNFHIFNNTSKDYHNLINNNSNDFVDLNESENYNNNINLMDENLNLNYYKLNKDTINQCMNFYQQFEKKCNYEKKNYNKEKICYNWLRKQRVSNFCYYAIFEIINNFESEALNLLKKNGLNIKDLSMKDIIYYYLNNLRKENIEKIIKYMKEDEEGKNNNLFEDTIYQGENDDEDDDDNNLILQYLKKDCIEYGLKSSNENLIVCTKYE